MAQRDKASKRAIALKYDADKGAAPLITAVGKGAVADRIIELAGESGVRTVEDEFQANALSSLDAGARVPKFLYDLVAEVLLFVEEADIKNQNGGVLH
ncbi:MAG: EscU/YscU/HrcU family type III secretion system export apparatus switch protein [Clostridiales bacterium]|jgi:flagellar biosynthesis protein|nr:EscU/YscU/HrcU family type III secretion system export apparatus switch protein [Clostridiales bacterium]